jgi:hypothetical protein
MAAIVYGENIITDHQWDGMLEMVYQILEAKFEAGKSKEEILASIASLMRRHKDNDNSGG